MNAICTLCDEAETPVMGHYLLSTGERISLGICRGCSAAVRELMGDAAYPTTTPADPPIAYDPNDETPPCSFCGTAQSDVDKLVACCRYYQTSKWFQKTTERVAHDRLFWAAKADQNPVKVGSLFVCDGCVARADTTR